MAYEAQGMTLIPQDKDMACWYASAQMVIQWRRNRVQMCEQGILDPSEHKPAGKLYQANNGIGNRHILELAKALGLRPVQMSVTPDGVESLIRTHGPLWVNGTRHITVLGGARKGDVKVYDPWPPNKGAVAWRSWSKWLHGGTANGSMDMSAGAAASYLYCPA